LCLVIVNTDGFAPRFGDLESEAAVLVLMPAGISVLARISRASPLSMSDAVTFVAAAGFRLVGRVASPSSRFAADESTISCVSVSLVIIGPSVLVLREFAGFHCPEPLLRKAARGD
jgi:hypothetical protein